MLDRRDSQRLEISAGGKEKMQGRVLSEYFRVLPNLVGSKVYTPYIFKPPCDPAGAAYAGKGLFSGEKARKVRVLHHLACFALGMEYSVRSRLFVLFLWTTIITSLRWQLQRSPSSSVTMAWHSS